MYGIFELIVMGILLLPSNQEVCPITGKTLVFYYFGYAMVPLSQFTSRKLPLKPFTAHLLLLGSRILFNKRLQPKPVWISSDKTKFSQMHFRFVEHQCSQSHEIKSCLPNRIYKKVLQWAAAYKNQGQ